MDQHLCQKKLEESRKKLAEILQHLGNANKLDGGNKEAEWCCIDQIVSSIEELQTMISWIAQRKGIPEDNSVVMQKLEQLNKIRKVLQRSALESQQYLCHLKNESQPEKELHFEKYKPDIFNDSHMKEKKSSNKRVTFPGIPFSMQQNNCNRNYETCIDGDNNFQSIDQQNTGIDKERDGMDSYIKKLCSLPQSLTTQSFSDLHRDIDDHHDSLGTAISEDEGLGEESRRGDFTGLNSLLEISDTGTDLIPLDACPPVTLRYKEQISPTSNPRENLEWNSDSCCHRNSIELCLATISKLKESLNVKENEILQLKSGTQDKSNAQELQQVVNNLQQVVNNLQQNVDELQSSAFILEKENASLKENLLELEEAENDARLQCQRLEEKLIFLQQKDSHFQVELTETKHALKLCLEELSLNEAKERELHSQLKFMEVLVQKYEEQLKHFESAQLSLEISESGGLESKGKSVVETSTKGTQSYFPLPLKQHVDASINTLTSELKDTKDTTVQVEPLFVTLCSAGVDNCVQTDPLSKSESTKELPSLICFGCEVSNSVCDGKDENQDLSYSITCPVQKELFNRLHHLVEEDANLQQQLHHVDQINLSLWKKLHSLQFHIGECQKEQVSSSGTPVINPITEICVESPLTNENIFESVSSETKKCSHLDLFSSLDSSEAKLKERLSHLEKINSSFVKKLENREKLYLEKERKHENWLDIEKKLLGELKALSVEKESLTTQVTQLDMEKAELTAKVKELEAELAAARTKHQQETSALAAERDKVMVDLQTTIDELITREKEYLKQIAKLKSSNSKSDDKSEFERWKSNYVQLQIELVGYRDKMETMKQDFDDQLSSLKESHSVEESRLLCELGECHGKDDTYDKKLNTFHARQLELENDVKAKEKALEEARNEFKHQIQLAEEEHKLVEAELRKKLSQMEEGTTMATKALKEERARLERELQENIDDLRSKEEQYKARILELESNVSQLHQELHRLSGNLHTTFDSDDSHVDETMTFQRQHLMNELQELRDHEEELREKLDEMEKKEAAYRETLEHADRIVATVERGYRNKIEELEMSERCLKQRIGYLEDVESRLRVALQKERRSSDGRKPDDLVLELAEAEKREQVLKDEVSSLEQSNRTANQKIRELAKTQQQLETQLADREELATSLEKLQTELESIRNELAWLRKSEKSLQVALFQTENLLEARESEITSEMKRFASEKQELEETISQLRSQVRDLKEKSEKDQDETEGETLDKHLAVNRQHSPEKHRKRLNGRGIQAEDTERKPSETVSTGGSAKENLVTTPRSTTSVMQMVKHIEKQSNAENIPRKKPVNDNISKSPEKTVKAVSRDPDLPRMPCDGQSVAGATKAEKEYSEVRMQLEECMIRAMDAMKMEMEQKSVTEPTEEKGETNTETFISPHNFRVIQQVGSDTVLVGWDYVDVPNLEGFELYVNDQLHETVYASDRRKAVISGIELNKSMVLSICAVSTSGQVSKPQTLELSQKTCDGFFFQDDDDDDDDDELFSDDISDKQMRPYSVEW